MENLKLKMNSQFEVLVTKIIQEWPSQLDGHLHYCIGLSGGVDSVVLLYLFNQIRQHKSIKLSAIHVNHGLSPHADMWTNFCQELCEELAIPLQISRVKVEKIAGEGLENSARKLRYQEYAGCSEQDVIVLAHHLDDQIETTLSQLMRGSDIHNLAAMTELNYKQNHWFWRPLLSIDKAIIKQLALDNHIANIEDESNRDNHYLRNFLRNQIIPELVDFDGHVKIKLLQSITSLQSACSLQDEIAADDLAQVSLKGNVLDLELFLKLSPLRKVNLLNFYIRSFGLPLPSKRRVAEFIRQVAMAKVDRHPQLQINHLIKLQLSKQIISINSF